MNFTYQTNPSRVVFGVGSFAALEAEVFALGIKKAMIVSTPSQQDLALRAQQMLGGTSSIFSGAVMHVPEESITEALGHLDANSSDGLVCTGGSTTIGLAKAVALERRIPIVAVPTTYAGSEMTPIWGITRAGIKLTGRDNHVQPRTVIYDPLLTITLPVTISGASGINAMAHSVEALYAENRNPVIAQLCEMSISSLAESLPLLVLDMQNLEARTKALFGSWLAGTALGSVGMAIHHKLCHVLGGSFSLPHAEVHAVLLPYSLAYNSDYAPEAMAAIARSLKVSFSDVCPAMFDLVASVGAPTDLASIGMQEEDITRAADIAMQKPYYNPRPVTHAGVLALLKSAFAGLRP
jgi:maleylacetate reductase